MQNYNTPKDKGYQSGNSYSNSQGYSVILPIYTSSQNTKRKSKCPKGANLNEIGSCCGDRCTRACLIEDTI